MIYTILKSPPGCPPEHLFLVYVAPVLKVSDISMRKSVFGSNGERFFATIADARSVIPNGATKMQISQLREFVEAWETSD